MRVFCSIGRVLADRQVEGQPPGGAFSKPLAGAGLLLRHSGMRRQAQTRNLEIPGSRWRAPRNDGSPDIPQHRFDGLALIRRERGLGGDGIADLVALDRKPSLDARRQIVTRERFVDAPQPPL